MRDLIRRVMASLCLGVLLFIHSSALAHDQASLGKALDRVLDEAPTARRTTVALKVIDVATGEVIYDRFGDRLLTPASNLKIYTSACALDVFGPKHCFETSVVALLDKERGVIEDLFLVGGGDSMFTIEKLKELASQMTQEWSVKVIRGKLGIDNYRYSATQLGPGWMWDDQPYYFNMRVTPLMVDFNTKTIPGKFDSKGEPVREAVQDPEAWAAELFSKMLRDQGVMFGPEHAQENGATTNLTSFSFTGTDLATTLRHFNHVSENAVGEVLLHEVAIAKGIRQPTWKDGAQVITDWLQETAGLEEGSFRLVDGSGLSRYNLISADSSVQLLRFMRGHKHYETFFAALNEYEVEVASGTPKKLVRAKTGGMSGVSTISGYLETLAGRQLAFSLLGNGFIGSQEPVKALRGQVWQELAKYRAAE